VGGILGQKPVNSSTIDTDRISAVPGLRVEGTREGSFSSALQAKGQERKNLPIVTTRPANPTQSGGRRARPCRRVVLSVNTRPGRKPRRACTHGVDRGKTPTATNTSCVTGSLHARVEGRGATLTPRPLIPSVPLRPSENPPQTPIKLPQRTLPSGHMRQVSAEDGRSFGHRLE